MCGGGGGQAPDNSAQIRMQEQQMALQREQMAMQQEQANAQKAQYQEQLAISKAPPPPASERGGQGGCSQPLKWLPDIRPTSQADRHRYAPRSASRGWRDVWINSGTDKPSRPRPTLGTPASR
jgi:hypothetical protein